MQKPTARYFAETDSMVIDIIPGVPAARTDEVAQDILVDYDENGRVVAIEFPGGVRELLTALLASDKMPQQGSRSAREPNSGYDLNESDK